MAIPVTKKILYVSDLGNHTRPVFRQAISYARAHDAKIMMLHVVEPMTDATKMALETYFPNDIAKEMKKDGMKKVLATMRERVKKFVQDECSGGICELTPVEEIFVVEGKPSEVILRIAEEQGADLIVMGKSARKVRGIRILGDTARRVSKHAKVPVLIIPNRTKKSS
ncbi:MAG: universal stress protein [Desulfotalea sp.]